MEDHANQAEVPIETISMVMNTDINVSPTLKRATNKESLAPPMPVACCRACVDAFERLGYDVDSTGVGARRQT
jgi:hypothetical protein